MARIRNSCMHSKRVTLIWVLCAFLFFCTFQMILKNSSFNNTTSPSLDAQMEKRTRLYEKMARDLDEHGAAFLQNGETSQSLSLSDLFSVKEGVVTPNLKAANPPVRANVLYLSTEYSIPISKAVKMVFSPYFDKAIWFQNSSLYHFSMFHASHHIEPVPASDSEVEAEANAVKSVAESLCPLKLVLDKVVLTSTGVLLGCWQYDATILHTSFARLLGSPRIPNTVQGGEASDQIKFLHKLVAQLNNQIRGFQGIVSELWYVEELDVLALAVNGKMKVRRFQLSCSKA